MLYTIECKCTYTFTDYNGNDIDLKNFPDIHSYNEAYPARQVHSMNTDAFKSDELRKLINDEFDYRLNKLYYHDFFNEFNRLVNYFIFDTNELIKSVVNDSVKISISKNKRNTLVIEFQLKNDDDVEIKEEIVQYDFVDLLDRFYTYLDNGNGKIHFFDDIEYEDGLFVNVDVDKIRDRDNIKIRRS